RSPLAPPCQGSAERRPHRFAEIPDTAPAKVATSTDPAVSPEGETYLMLSEFSSTGAVATCLITYEPREAAPSTPHLARIPPLPGRSAASTRSHTAHATAVGPSP